jgi:PAS domain S-box-containing protein
VVADLLQAAKVRWLDELASAGVFTTDTSLAITSWNQWFERATGRSSAAVVGQPLFEVFPDIAARGLDRYYRAALRGEVGVLAHRFHGHLVRIQTPAGDMPQSTRIAPLLVDHDVIGTVTVVEDVSERVNSEAELRRQIAAAEQARAVAEDALRVKDEFLATLSHELRTPLNAVLGWTNILLAHPVNPEMLDRALHVIDRNAAAQARLIDDMLDMARIVTGKLRLEMKPVDLVSATLAAIDVVTPTAHAKNITIRKLLGTTPGLITADPDRIQQIIWNILSNGVKFTPSGGSIDVRIDHQGTTVRLNVSDTGKGIAADFLPHVFERFRQANSSVSRTEGGLGLGLALVRQLVEMHGGSIGVVSDGADKGSTFTVTFPAVVEEALTPRVPRPPALPANALESRRILIVDAEDDWRDLLAAVLSEGGAHVVGARTAREAFDIMSQGPGDLPDLMLADLGLPGENGCDLMRRIRRLEGPAGRVAAMAVTAYAAAANERRALDAGFDVFRAKPISPEEVGAAVLSLVERRLPRRLVRPAIP